MGVKKLYTFLNDNNLYKIYDNLNHLTINCGQNKNKIIIGIDANLFFYKYTHSCKNMLMGFYNQIIKFLQNGFCPLYIFDGGTIKQKEKTNIERNNNKNTNKIKLEELKTELEILKNNNENNTSSQEEELNILINKTYKKTIKISNKYILQLTELLELFNVPYIFAHGEGEYLAVLLNNYNIIDYFLTDDTDTIPAGINNIIKFTNGKTICLHTDNIYKTLEINKDKFINLCVLMGTDYSYFNIKKNKPCELFDIIKKNDNIEDVYNYFQINKEEFEDVVNIYKNVAITEKCYLLNDLKDINVNIINNHNLGIFSTILKLYWNEFLDVLNTNKNSTLLKTKIIKNIKNNSINVNNVLIFLNTNTADLSSSELKNIENNLNNLNKYRNK